MKNKRRSVLGDPLDREYVNNKDKQEPEDEKTVKPESGRASRDRGQEDQSFRGMDTGLGQPDPEPGPADEMRDVSSEEIEELRREQDRLRRRFEEKLLELEQTGIRLPRVLYRTLLWTAIFLAAVLGLFLISHGVRFAGQVSALGTPWNVLAVSGFVLFTGAILVVVIKLAGRFMAFRNLARVDLKALNLLAERQRFRWLARQKKDEARDVLTGYLKEYRIQDTDAEQLGLDREELARIYACRQRLLDKRGYVDSSAWLREMDETFVYSLDRAARKRIRSYSRTVALGTAASPIRFIDQIIVLYASLRLISELLQIYNLRPALGQSMFILARAIIQAYLSGIIGEQAEAGVETFGDYYQSIFGEVSFATGVSAATDAARFVLPKAGEGALNGFLIWRLGRQAQRMLRPL